jgi:hypothetical protein
MCPNKVKMLQGGEPMNHGEMALKPMGYFGHRRRKSIYSCEFVMPGPGEPAWLTGHNQTGSSVFFFCWREFLLFVSKKDLWSSFANDNE